MESKEVGKLIYDTIMGNTSMPQFNYDAVAEQTLYCDSGEFIFATRKDEYFRVTVTKI